MLCGGSIFGGCNDAPSRNVMLGVLAAPPRCRGVPPARRDKLAAAAGLEKPVCQGMNLGLSVHVERDLVIKVTICVRIYAIERLIVSRAGPVQGPRGLCRRRVSRVSFPSLPQRS